MIPRSRAVDRAS